MLKRVVTRRLPGFRFEADAPTPDEVLPRMDVACFIGFAASGPLDVPVAVESVAQFNAIFGADAQLAWDAKSGAPVYAHLAPAVRAFFANGGRRCRIVRVARVPRDEAEGETRNGARANFFPIPGTAQVAFGADGKVKSIGPAFARARSEGSWSDALEVSAALLARPAQVKSFSPSDHTVELAADAPDDLVAGDLLRLTFKDDGYVLMFFVETVAPVVSSPPDARPTISVGGGSPIWLRTTPPDSLTDETSVDLSVFTTESKNSSPPSVDDEEFASHYRAILRLPQTNASSAGLAGLKVGEAAVEVELPLEDAPAPGSVVRVERDGLVMMLTVEEFGIASRSAGSAAALVRLTGRAHWLLTGAPALSDLSKPACERLSFELRVSKADEYALSVSDLSFGAKHARYWGRLPTDEQVYRPKEAAPVNEPAEELWQPLGEQRFPLASPGAGDAVYFPLAMSPLADQPLGAVRLRGDALERDGLAEFDAALFIDADLADATTADLMERADFIRYLGGATRPLRGIHAALSVEEVTIICAPDSVHRAWSAAEQGGPRPPKPSRPFARPEWWHFLDCRKQTSIPLARRPQLGHFLACGVRVFPRPRLETGSDVSETGTFTLAWRFTRLDSHLTLDKFVLEESADTDFASVVTIYEGTATTYTFYGQRPGDHYFRVRAEYKVGTDGANDSDAVSEGANDSGDVREAARDRDEAKIETSDWSNGVAVRVRALGRRRQDEEETYDPRVLLAVQRALLRACAARADMIAVLAMPAHFREDKSLEHAAALRRVEALNTSSGAGVFASDARVPALNSGEANALSYGALYHPWLTGRDPFDVEKFRAVPPDGAACGVLARRAISRGAWIAPANEKLSGVVALAPPMLRERWLDLQLAQVNLVRQEPRGFLAMNADTLSLEEDLREISVRRLLILLRRLCLRHGATYVFEPNSAAFRRLVQRGFESVLDQLFARGAFAGATAAASYRVDATGALNTPQSVEAGRFVVELRVAPSQPLTFMTIRLVQTGDRGFVTEVSANG
jgi:hypothetical protein